MRRWRRTSAVCRWAGLVACVVTIAAWVVSLFWTLGIEIRARAWWAVAGVSSGSVALRVDVKPVPTYPDLHPGLRPVAYRTLEGSEHYWWFWSTPLREGRI